MNTRDIKVGEKKAEGFHIELPGAPLLLARGEKGFVMCGYLNIAVADKFGQAAAVVRGVKTLEEPLAKPVTDVSEEGKKRGIVPGMTGLEALEKLV